MKKSYYNIGSIGFVFMLTTVCGNVKAQIQIVTVTGTIKAGEKLLSGVSVSQENSNQTAATNAAGIYRLEVSGMNPVIVFRHPEFGERKIVLGNRLVVNLDFSVSLESLDDLDKSHSDKVQGIEEVVVSAGYYKVRDKERTGSIAKISAKEIENQPLTNVLSAAQGRMAGVSISQNSGVPGGGFDIQIRGRNSLRNKSNSEVDGNQPLYVIDGVPFGSEMTSLYSQVILPSRSINPLNSINPNDIEKIEILKDADATAIYGSRGANGVVLVTTKKGRSGKLGVTFNSSYGISQMISNLKMMNTEQYLGMRRQAFTNNNITVIPAPAYDLNGQWETNRMTDWEKVLIGNTATNNISQLSLTGGSETTSFLVSLNHNRQTTVFGEDFRYKTTGLLSQFSHRSADKKLQLNVSNNFSIQKNNIPRSDNTRQSYLLPPNAPALYNADGSINWQNNTWANPLAAYNSTYTNENRQFLTSINVQYELIPDLYVKLNGGLNYQTFDELSLQPNTMYNPAFANGQTSATSVAYQNSQDRTSIIIEPQISYLWQRNDHKIDALVGGTFQSDTSEQGSMVGIGFESNLFLSNIGAAKTKTVSDQLTKEYRYAAVFGRLNYQFKRKYILNITGRRDGSSRFGPNNKFANFGAVGAAWLFDKEKLFEKLDWLSFGKLRGSLGTAGSDNIGDHQYIDSYAISANHSYNNVTGLIPTRLYNPDYSWEKTTKLEAALEMGFFKNRLNLTAAWYRNRSSNQLIGYQLPATTGFSSVLANLNAEVENRGWEFELTARPFSGKFKWETGINITFPKNRLISFPGLEGSTYSNQYMIDRSTSIVKLYELTGIDTQTGAYVFTDFNGDGKISSPDDNRIVEDLSVQYFGGWNNSFDMGQWNFSFLFQFVKQQGRNYNNIMTIPGSMNNQPIEVLNVWSSSNPQGDYMPYTTLSNTSHNLFQNSTASVSDASFIRLKNIQLSYTIPLKSNMFRNVKIYAQGQNLLTMTNYFGLDPESSVIGFLPPLKTYSFGLQLTL
ncbi:SusC/RagA family TonB-linked outer membrane protein [Chryseobacterium sp. NKUCC03_KSP]|uniref:SusC/RagA family TonB-linked outer membrane protein n=1 Tax=Chryseobacterium sp. NKUCC03_KSP TaxID=2842125 RepID=UPI001C5B5B64|nr:SusC/RagA family TonB-linked outer membrane protein [Chryseobacterium sp. NKUCC03_KSP]MBW3524330.1 SusC/RagA family TonB-linked outer membrane protein [Chryseobacterium sp. NKUCC03_KSP]